MARTEEPQLNPEVILGRLEKLSKLDKDRSVFGSNAHNYKLNSPLGISEIKEFENQHGISLPRDYRSFIASFGNGGAGPGYGLFPFGRDDEGRWEETLSLGDPGNPFPHKDAWNLPDEFWRDEPNVPEGLPTGEEDQLWDEWDAKLARRYWSTSIMNGAIPICHLGCAHRQWLVVVGEQKGFVWDDLRADHGGLTPVKNANGDQMTFAEWYLAWLKEAERHKPQRAHHKLSNRLQHAFHPLISPKGSRLRNWLQLLLLILIGVIVTALLARF